MTENSNNPDDDNSIEQEPKEPQPNGIESIPSVNQCSANEGVKWVSQSFSLFSKNPSIWVVMFILNVVINIVLSKLPFLVLLSSILAPVFSAGFIYAAKRVDNDHSLEIDHLFAGFKLSFKNLFRLGMNYFLCYFILVAIFTLLLGSFTDEQMLAQMNKASSTEELQQLIIESPVMLDALLKAFLIAMILSMPVIMASWFAPALVLFHKMTPIQAMLLSLQACNTNWRPFALFGALMIPMMLLAILPFALGLLILMPVIFISQYCSYKAVFGQQHKSEGTFLV